MRSYLPFKSTPPLLALAFGILGAPATAEILTFDLSPPGATAAVGLSPQNEVPVATGDGSGGVLPGGITFDTDTNVLEFAIGYGSVAGFTNLTGPATAAHIHGPAAIDMTAGTINNFFDDGKHLPAGDPADGGFIVGSLMLTAPQATDLLAGLLYVNIHTAANPPGEVRAQLIEVTNAPPTVDCPDPITAECASPEGTAVTVTVTVSDPDGDPLSVIWMINGEEFETDEVPSGGAVTEAEVSVEGLFNLGTHNVMAMVTDGASDPVVCEVTVTVEDTTAPEIVSVTPDPLVLWPPNHTMRPISFDVEATDACGEVTVTVLSVESDEPLNGIGDGNTDIDWEITGPLSVNLRSERAGPGDGRTYTITVEASDAVGNTSTATATVEVPHSMGKSAAAGKGKAYRFPTGARFLRRR